MSTGYWNLMLAINAANIDNYLSFEQITDPDNEDGPFIDLVPYSGANPEEIMIENEKWNSLRQEAKELIDLLANCPNEIVVEIMGTRRRSKYRVMLTKEKVLEYLCRQWGDPLLAIDVIREVKNYLREQDQDE